METKIVSGLDAEHAFLDFLPSPAEAVTGTRNVPLPDLPIPEPGPPIDLPVP